MGCLIAKSDTQNGSNFLNMLKFYFLQNQNKLRIFGFLCKILCQTGNICQLFFFRLFRRIFSRGCCYEFESFIRRTLLVIECLAMSRRLNRLIIVRKSLFSTLLLNNLLKNCKQQYCHVTFFMQKQSPFPTSNITSNVCQKIVDF